VKIFGGQRTANLSRGLLLVLVGTWFQGNRESVAFHLRSRWSWVPIVVLGLVSGYVQVVSRWSKRVADPTRRSVFELPFADEERDYVLSGENTRNGHIRGTEFDELRCTNNGSGPSASHELQLRVFSSVGGWGRETGAAEDLVFSGLIAIPQLAPAAVWITPISAPPVGYLALSHAALQVSSLHRELVVKRLASGGRAQDPGERREFARLPWVLFPGVAGSLAVHEIAEEAISAKRTALAAWIARQIRAQAVYEHGVFGPANNWQQRLCDRVTGRHSSQREPSRAGRLLRKVGHYAFVGTEWALAAWALAVVALGVPALLRPSAPRCWSSRCCCYSYSLPSGTDNG
jgi:hypothetical protein